MPDFSALDLAAIGAIFLVSAFLQGMAGFGFGMVSMAILPFLLTARQSSIIVAPFAVLNTVMLLWTLRRHVHVPTWWRLVVGAAVGVPIGVHALTFLPDTILRRTIGVVLLVYCLYQVWRRYRPSEPGPPVSVWWGVPLGVLAGAIGGAVNVGGPPVVVFLYLMPWKRDTVRATLCAFFMFVSSLKVVLLLKGGMLPTAPSLYAVVLVTMWVGGVVGLRLGGKLSKRRFTATVLVMLAVLGVTLLVQG